VQVQKDQGQAGIGGCQSIEILQIYAIHAYTLLTDPSIYGSCPDYENTEERVKDKIPVAILGATGQVGQKFVLLLADHPQFRIAELVASQRSAGSRYADVCNWKQTVAIPRDVASMTVKNTDDPLSSPVLFSGLDSSVAGPVEEAYAKKGHHVISNSKNHRMDADVPIVIPEVNFEHLEIVKRQSYKGSIVTNSNCSTMFLVMALCPIHRAFGVEAVQVTTMQAISGAGYPGVASMDIIGNVVPFIGEEEEKMERETKKMLGTFTGGSIEPAPFAVSAQCNRVAVFDGHTETVSIKLSRKASPADIVRVLRSFKGIPQELGLHSAPADPIVVLDEADRPQPTRDAWINRGMSTIVGRVRPCPVNDIKMVILGHNTIRGAAGAAVLNGETMLAKGYIKA
jgi:aspartate-semialdehyde dehydrogenase